MSYKETELTYFSSVEQTTQSNMRTASPVLSKKDFCARCSNYIYPIELFGQIMGLKYHRQCFTCNACHRLLDLKTFQTNVNDLNDKNIYCISHAPKIGKGTFGYMDGSRRLITSNNSPSTPRKNLPSKWQELNKSLDNIDTVNTSSNTKLNSKITNESSSSINKMKYIDDQFSWELLVNGEQSSKNNSNKSNSISKHASTDRLDDYNYFNSNSMSKHVSTDKLNDYKYYNNNTVSSTDKLDSYKHQNSDLSSGTSIIINNNQIGKKNSSSSDVVKNQILSDTIDLLAHKTDHSNAGDFLVKNVQESSMTKSSHSESQFHHETHHHQQESFSKNIHHLDSYEDRYTQVPITPTDNTIHYEYEYDYAYDDSKHNKNLELNTHSTSINNNNNNNNNNNKYVSVLIPSNLDYNGKQSNATNSLIITKDDFSKHNNTVGQTIIYERLPSPSKPNETIQNIIHLPIVIDSKHNDPIKPITPITPVSPITPIIPINNDNLSKDLKPLVPSLPQILGKNKGYGVVKLTIFYDELRKRLSITVHEAQNLRNVDKKTLSDPYARVYLVPDNKQHSYKRKTKIVKDNLNPKWNETFDHYLTLAEAQSKTLIVNLKDERGFLQRQEEVFLGEVVLKLSDLDIRNSFTSWFYLQELNPTAKLLTNSGVHPYK